MALFLITGAVMGGIIGDLLADSSVLSGMTPYLIKQFLLLDIPPFTVNLYVVKFSVGVVFSPNLVSILGMIAAGILYRYF